MLIQILMTLLVFVFLGTGPVLGVSSAGLLPEPEGLEADAFGTADFESFFSYFLAFLTLEGLPQNIQGKPK